LFNCRLVAVAAEINATSSLAVNGRDAKMGSPLLAPEQVHASIMGSDFGEVEEFNWNSEACRHPTADA
jgi:hypothetical protein